MIDVLFIHAMYFIRTLDTNDMPIKYGDLARYILQEVCHAKGVDFVYDSYPSPSLIEEEQKRRGNQEQNILIAFSQNNSNGNYFNS